VLGARGHGFWAWNMTKKITEQKKYFMAKIESRIGVIKSSEEKIYNFLSNFNNFKSLIPEDRVKEWESTDDTCRFTVDAVGRIGLKIIEKEPHKMIKITSDESTPLPFRLWIQIKSVEENDSRIKITVDAEVNPLIAPMVKGPLQSFVDTLVDQAEKMEFQNR
jgi:carbon monoxide dehydrogenase subunit G